MAKDANYRRMINTSKWRALRGRKMNDNPLCEECLKRGVYEPAKEVHHKVPVESAISDGEMFFLMFDYDNLQALCHNCHVEAHKAILSHERATKVQRNEKRVERFKKRFL